MAELSKELQAQINELKTKAMSDDELDNVAGGTTMQNWELVQALAYVDPEGVQNIMANFQNSGGNEKQLASDIMYLITKDFPRLSAYASDNQSNYYYSYLDGGKEMSHKEVLNFIKSSAQK